MIIGVVKETYPNERRVAIVPATVASLKKAGLDVVVESGAGLEAGYRDEEYSDKGVALVGREQVFKQSDIILQVRGFGANPENGKADIEQMREGQIVIGMLDPLWRADCMRELAERKVTAFAMELIPRITRAQAMDVLSSMANIAGYKSALLAASYLPKMFPMMMTAAGSIAPAKVFVIGAGVAGLQAIATAKRLGAVVQAYDVRPAVKEQVESLGAKFVELELEPADGEGGYAREMDEEFYRKQREMMSRILSEVDVVITTAAIPGKKSPVLITAEMVSQMSAGSVIIDLAAERGGNCELTKADEKVEVDNVSIYGPTNLPSTVPYHASQMYAKNISTFTLNLFKEGQLELNTEDEIIRDTLVCRNGEIVNKRVLEALEALEG